MRIMLAVFFLSSTMVVAQQRYLISSKQEVIPLSKSQSAALVMRNRLHPTAAKVSAACGNKFTFGYTETKFPPSVNHIAFHKDIMGEWFVAKASGTIDSVFWESGSVNSAKDSILLVRIHNSVIGPTYGPGVRPGPFDPPCQSWGYWPDNQDADQGVAAFPEDANPQPSPWHSTINHGTSGPPFANEIWGLGGYPATDHVNVINHVAMLDNGFPCSVTVGQVFFINMRVNSINAHVDDAAGGVIWLTWNGEVNTSDENYPSRNWKFYEHDSGPSNCGIDKNLTKRGWVARGGFNGDDTLNVAALNWWYTMTVTTNTPPEVTDTDIPHNTLSTGDQTIGADITDCNPASPGSAGVTSAWIYWSLNDVPQPRIAMDAVIGDAWQGTIPGQVAGSTVNYFVRAFDSDSAVGNGQSITYRIVDLTNNYYVIDTFSVCSHANISGTGTEIDTSKFYNDQYGANNELDDGEAGPFAIPGGPMPIFGDTARYVWVGTNGAIALAKSATDTMDITASGAYSGTWTFPERQRHGRTDTVNQGLPPGNLIAPFYADFILGDTTAQYGHIVYGDGGDACQFIVEWDSLGTFDNAGPIPDNSTFRVILNRCSGVIRYEYDIVGTHGQDSAALVGMQADSNTVTAGYAGAQPGYVFLNRNAFPLETKPTAGRCIVFTPGAALYAKAGWNLLSVSNTPLSYQKAVLYPGATSAAFKYKGSYQTAATLNNGTGYWLKYASPIYAGAPGHHLASVLDTVGTGWNMIGTPATPVTPASVVASGTSTTSSYFGYNGSGYVIIGSLSNPTMNPGNGYWIKVNGNGTLQLTGSTNLPKESPVADELGATSSITIRDARGNSQTLYLGSDAAIHDASLYELPPSMADLSGFDVRFASGRAVETYPAVPAKDQTFEYPVKVQTDAYPITVAWSRGKGVPSDLKVAVRDDKGKLFGVIDGSSGLIRITNNAVKTLVINLGGNFNVPKVFALSQNYPNPFNPTTHFSVDVPRTTNVEIAVYDILGQKVTTLLAGEQPAGRMTVTWDGRDGNGMTAPSGAYFVRMKADDFNTVRKIMMMK